MSVAIGLVTALAGFAWSAAFFHMFRCDVQERSQPASMILANFCLGLLGLMLLGAGLILIVGGVIPPVRMLWQLLTT